MLLPVPKKIEFVGGVCALPARPALHIGGKLDQAGVFLRELQATRAGDAGSAAISLLPVEAAPASLRVSAQEREGYALRVGKQGVTIWAGSRAGWLYGAMTLRQLRAQYGDRIPCLVIRDRPALARRGVQLSFPQGHTEYRSAYMRHLIPWLARWKINELYLYLESYFDFPSLPHMAGPGAMTPEDALALDALCRAYNIEVIPMLNVLAHSGELLATQRYQHLTEYKPPEDQRVVRPFNLCASNREVERLVDGMLDDLIACFTAGTIHVGGDEVSCIGECPTCRKKAKDMSAFGRYSQYYGRVLEILQRNGRRGGIWGDMLLHYCQGKPDREQKRLLRRWRENAVIYDWHYSGGGRESLKLFTGAGLTTIACSSTHLCYSSAVWPAQSVNQRLLFNDAQAVGAAGGMTTAWGNFTGLHEEQFNYLHATGATILWSGADGSRLARGLDTGSFDRAYRLQRYGLRTCVFTDYLHLLGDAGGPVLRTIKPLHGLGLRKCLYHTTNVLDFWFYAAGPLGGGKFGRYKAAIARARGLWKRIGMARPDDPYLWAMEGPLLNHEHLIARYAMTEAVYSLYNQAARAQYDDVRRFRALLEKAASRLLQHLKDFGPIDAYLARGRRELGFEQSTIHRISATKAGIRELAALIRYFGKLNRPLPANRSLPAYRPLPAFQQLCNVYLEPFRTNWYGDREHEWAAESPRFRRFSITLPGPWSAEATEERE